MTIGIGDGADKAELHAIASQPDVVFKVDTYDALKRLKKILAFKACEGTAVAKFPKPFILSSECRKSIPKYGTWLHLFWQSANLQDI